MVRKIFKTGNSMVVSLPREMLDALHLSEGEEVSVESMPTAARSESRPCRRRSTASMLSSPAR